MRCSGAETSLTARRMNFFEFGHGFRAFCETRSLDDYKELILRLESCDSGDAALFGTEWSREALGI